MVVEATDIGYHGFEESVGPILDWLAMPSKYPKVLDLFCGEGGSAHGFQRAGYEVCGVDRKAKVGERYIGEHFIQSDIFKLPEWFIKEFEIINASPPCQAYSDLRFITAVDYEDYLEETRTLLKRSGALYIIENVPKAPLENPVMLCGTMFDLRIDRDWLRRHRHFETNWPLTQPPHDSHWGASIVIVGNGGGGEGMVGYKTALAGEARQVMEMPWASRYGCAQAIPPAYTAYIGEELKPCL